MGLAFYFTQTEHDDQVWGASGSDWAMRKRAQYLASGDRSHEIVDDPLKADIILFWEPHQDAQIVFAPRLRAHPLVRDFPNKVFVISVEDQALGFLPGLYCSLPSNLHHRQRHRSWIYDTTPNPYIGTFADSGREAPETLASFMGADSASVRSRLFEMGQDLEHYGIRVARTGSGKFNANPDDPALRQAQIDYIDAILDAKFTLCPRGHGHHTFRLQETMVLGRAPVIISDLWVPIVGPDWHAFSIFIREQDIAALPRILAEYEPCWQEMGAKARMAHATYFTPEHYVTHALNQIASLYRSRCHDERDFIDEWDKLINWARAQSHLAYARQLGEEAVGRASCRGLAK